MKIDINSKYAITSDPLQFFIVEKSIGQSGKSKGKQIEKVIGCYGDLNNCYQDLVNIVVKASDASSFADLVTDILKIKEDIDKSLEVTKYE